MEHETDLETADPLEKLDLAASHRDRANALVDEAEKDAIHRLREEISFDATICAEYIDSLDAIEVTAIPEESIKPHQKVDADSISGVSTIHYHPHDTEIPDHINGIRELIDYLEQFHENGVPRHILHKESSSIGLDTAGMNEEIGAKQQTGHVYMPYPERFRTS